MTIPFQFRAQPSHFINLTFQDFDIIGGENCQYDYLAVYDGDTNQRSNLIGRFCNTKKPPTEIVSSWNSLYLEFSSDADENGRGFSLKYASKSFQMPADIHVYDLDGKFWRNVFWNLIPLCYKIGNLSFCQMTHSQRLVRKFSKQK